MKSLWIISLIVVALGLSACSKGDGRKPTFEVSGRVVLSDGNPAEHATVVLHPLDESVSDVVKPRAKVAADGSFKLTTYDGHDGAPSGEYRVTVELWLASGRGDEGPTSRLPAKYARPETSGLTAVVKDAPTELKPIEIKR